MPRRDKVRVRPLSPIDPYRVITGLTLTAGKAAELCGISRRQLSYWADKGIIEAISEDGAGTLDASRRLYDLAAVYRAMLIKRELDRGNSLHHAVQEVDRVLREHTEREREVVAASPADREQFLIKQAGRLVQIVHRLREAVAAHPGTDALLPLAQVLLLLGETATDSDITTGLRDDPETCCWLADALDRIDSLLDALGSRSAR